MIRDSRSYETQIIDAVRAVNRALGGTYGTSSAINKSDFNQYEVQLIDAIKGIGRTLSGGGISIAGMGNVDLTNYVTRDEFQSLSSRVTVLENESFFRLVDGNVTLKEAYSNLWVPGWLAAGGVGSGSSGGSAVAVSNVKTTGSPLFDISIDGVTTTIKDGLVWGTYNDTAKTVGLTLNGTQYILCVNGYSAGGGVSSESDPIFTASAAYGITSSDITNWNSKTSNVGTITGITMNGNSMGTSGVVDLGTVITSHQSLANYVTLDGTQTITGSKTFSVNTAFTNNISVGGTVSVAGKDMIDLTQSGMTMFGFGSRAERSFNGYGTTVNLRACDANGDQVNILSVQNGVVVVGSKLIPNYMTGLDLGGSSSNQRWNTIYGVNANLSGSLSVETISVGSAVLSYDSTSKALHVSGTDGGVAVGFYADGPVASGGVGDVQRPVQYVNCTQAEYNALQAKDPATLYAISQSGGSVTKVYLGTTLIYQ